MLKTSVRFFEDVPVRAVWDNETSKWWYAAADIAEALTKSKNPRVYWAQFKRRNAQLITICKQLKLTAPDGKKYATDVVDDDLAIFRGVGDAAPRKERHAKECRSSPLMLWKRRCVRHK